MSLTLGRQLKFNGDLTSILFNPIRFVITLYLVRIFL
jgi:hypothetical protein